MIEKIIYLEGIDPLNIYSVNNENFEILKRHYPKMKIIARGNEIKIFGEKGAIADFEEKMHAIIHHYNTYNRLMPEDISAILEERKPDQVSTSLNNDDVIVYGNYGKIIKARSANQQKLVDAYSKDDLIFAVGPAGSGKTYTAIALAVRSLRMKEVKRIVLTRPAVEAGEHLGFLPGDLKEKLDPYLQPLYDALNDMIPVKKLNGYLEDGTVQIAPLAFMRGRTLENSFVILDEAQNATINQLKMFLTRMGNNSRFIVNGDVTQIDLPDKRSSGLVQVLKILNNIPGISFVYFNVKDIVRHPLVKKIVKAYDELKKEVPGKLEQTNE